MKFNPPQTLKQLSVIIGGAKYAGPDDFIVTGLNEIHKVEHGDLSFVDHPKYYEKVLASDATAILINKEVQCPEGKVLLFSDDPFRDFNRIIAAFHTFKPSSTFRSDTISIGKGSVIQPGVFIGEHVTIGANCIIHPHVTIYENTIVGDNVIIHANTVIGADAFYYKRRPEGYDKFQTCGRVVIHDRVEIGASCTIDRGVTGDTVIGEGSKLDNQVHVGHDTVIGKNCLFAAQVGISGAVVIEDEVTLWGQVGVPSKLVIGKGAVVLGQSGLTKSLEGNKTYFGSPAAEAREKMKEMVLVKKLPALFDKLK